MGGKVQGIRSINGGYKIDRGRLRIVWEMEKPKNLHVGPMDMGLSSQELRWWNAGGWGVTKWKGIKGRKKKAQLNSIINKIYIYF